jgi:hypothetical protein
LPIGGDTICLKFKLQPGTIKTVKLSNGQEVFDISGEGDVLVENYGEFAIFGT